MWILMENCGSRFDPPLIDAFARIAESFARKSAEWMITSSETDWTGAPTGIFPRTFTKTQDSERLLLDLCRRYVNLFEEPDAGNPQAGFCEDSAP